MATNGVSSNSLVIHIGQPDQEGACSSLEHIEAVVSTALEAPQDLDGITHLKVLGEWVPRRNDAHQDGILLRIRSVSGSSESDIPFDSSQEQDGFDPQTEKEWVRGIKVMRKLIASLSDLNTLE